jgi:hypothetical protein
MSSSTSAHPNTKYLKINALLNPAKKRPSTTTPDRNGPSGTSHTWPFHIHVFHQAQQPAEVVPSFSANVDRRKARHSLRNTSLSAYRKYYDEEIRFIWYHRQHLSLDWDEVLRRFNQQFPNRQRPGSQGIQSVFYRCIRRQIENHPRSRTYNSSFQEQRGF